ncbi:MAG: 2-C-methyl-D-erythritol 2,4-cyclodiphosphate synthase [Verrucomicrobia bacterium RIFCSPHIGHO2_12_FULL_41_10]|nr:MAG: 2-C-methyl-D-erythritol 2,4-cyclodiphosphate synthase [Verrucomicrobia bacterium RIFCSPHIGHO2_12_FULL_41_10]HLB33836.1 2-C-methyl-D-erythritol 2,4-cyclodiphosphate synthase [Chthoniobacterales bacterium]
MTRTGIGYDVHPFVSNRLLILGGVIIPHPEGKGLAGHSDADVLCHAIADALLGAAGKRDIGYYFPNTDPSIQNISSLKILEKAAQLIREDQGELINIDATLIAEEPKIASYVETMRSTIAMSLGIDPSRIGIKATTNEGLGFLGRGEGIAALATASIAVHFALHDD